MIIEKGKLAEYLIKIYDFGYSTEKKSRKPEDEIMTMFADQLKSKIIDRIEFLYDEANYLIIEENYVEPEWKTMIAKHYINSAYSTTLHQSVIRIHFLIEKEFSQNSYLGFITLRPLEEIEIALSFVYVNWLQSFFSDEHTFVMTYAKEVHYMGNSVTIQTYPFFAQDSIVTCCADANVIMLKKFFANKFKISSTEKNSFPVSKLSREHKVPKRIESLLMKTMLTDADIPYRTQRFRNSEVIEKNQWLRIEKQINAYLESGLPVILGIDGHVVQLIGYNKSIDNCITSYIVYDDSGHLEKLNFEQFDEKKRHFTYQLSMQEIKKYCENNINTSFFLIFSEHERVYIDYERYTFFLIEYLLIFEEDGKINSNVSFRTMLVDNSVLKEFLLSNIIPEQEKIISNLLKKGLPHYLWYTEITIEGESFCLCADPTMYYNTRDIEKLFFDLGPIGLMDNKSLRLLIQSIQ